MSETVAPDSTIRSLVNRLAEKEEYIIGALRQISFSKGEPEPGLYRVGIRGAGSWPNYRVERPGQPHKYCVGRTHRPVEEKELHDENWSTEAITTTELLALLGEVAPRRMKRD